jgi:hypothetical protein
MTMSEKCEVEEVLHEGDGRGNRVASIDRKGKTGE